MPHAVTSQEISIQARPKSKQCFDSMSDMIPGGTNSPVRAFKGLGIDPMIADRGVGDMVYDIDGNGYIDYCGSWGPLIHGHAHPEIVAVAQERTAKGSTFGISTQAEEKLAKIIIKHVPSMERIRFVSSGTEATMSAARVARGYTKRNIIVKFAGNYHGHADFFLVQAGSGVLGINPSSTSEGIPDQIVQHTACLPFNDLETTQAFLLHPANRNTIAAVILEPIAGNMGCVAAKPEFLQMLRDVTRKIGALLIFDEVITGFRVSLGGAQALYGIQPDMTCLGKIIGGGFPAAAFGGRKEIMECLAPIGKVYQAGTLSGNPVAMEAGYKAIQLLEKNGVYDRLEHMTHVITDPVRRLFLEKDLNACVQQVGSMFTIFFGRREVIDAADARQCDLEAFARFFRYLFANGVYIPPMQQEAWFVSLAHTEKHLEETRDLILNYFHEI
ncbi:MAG: glutamate-1-semialdehyde 2,1-aminomutase [Parachlamydiaceae bacterium]